MLFGFILNLFVCFFLIRCRSFIADPKNSFFKFSSNFGDGSADSKIDRRVFGLGLDRQSSGAFSTVTSQAWKTGQGLLCMLCRLFMPRGMGRRHSPPPLLLLPHRPALADASCDRPHPPHILSPRPGRSVVVSARKLLVGSFLLGSWKFIPCVVVKAQRGSIVLEPRALSFRFRAWA